MLVLVTVILTLELINFMGNKKVLFNLIPCFNFILHVFTIKGGTATRNDKTCVSLAGNHGDICLFYKALLLLCICDA